MKKLSVLTESISGIIHAVNSAGTNGDITGLCADSREAKQGFVFFAIQGEHADGNAFVNGALKNGAAAVISTDPVPPGLADDVVYLQVENVHRALAEAAAVFYDKVHQQLSLIGVTGTNGKTTTASLIRQLLKAMGVPTLFIGTTGILIGDRPFHTDYTTPPPHTLHRLFAEAQAAGIGHAVMEVSSHAIALYRTHGLTFAGAVFTNLTHEHLELHPDMEDYFETKAALFTQLEPEGFGLVNSDDSYGQRLFDRHTGDSRFADYGLNAADFKMTGYRFLPEKRTSLLEYDYQGSPQSVACGLVGFHNGYNCLAAVAALVRLGFEPDRIESAPADTFGIPGRFEWFEDKGIQVVVDFAHSPDALEKLLDSVHRLRRELDLPKSRIILVFGCPGNRDPSKRPAMGRIAAEKADQLFITSDDPHYEDPEDIISDITKGVPDDASAKTHLDPDRKRAIEKALRMAGQNDFVIVAGRGHQKFQYVRDEKVLFHDRDEIQKILDVLS